MSSALILGLMTFLFLLFGYMGVPVAFSLMARRDRRHARSRR